MVSVVGSMVGSSSSSRLLMGGRAAKPSGWHSSHTDWSSPQAACHPLGWPGTAHWNSRPVDQLFREAFAPVHIRVT
jgi:hypothetical protein